MTVRRADCVRDGLRADSFGAGELGDGFGAFADAVLGQVTRKQKSNMGCKMSDCVLGFHSDVTFSRHSMTL